MDNKKVKKMMGELAIAIQNYDKAAKNKIANLRKEITKIEKERVNELSKAPSIHLFFQNLIEDLKKVNVSINIYTNSNHKIINFHLKTPEEAKLFKEIFLEKMLFHKEIKLGSRVATDELTACFHSELEVIGLSIKHHKAKQQWYSMILGNHAYGMNLFNKIEIKTLTEKVILDKIVSTKTQKKPNLL